MKRKYRIACLGGTFDVPPHKGHEALLDKAFETADFCYIGLASDEYAWRKGKLGIRSYAERKRSLEKFLASARIRRSRYSITSLENFFGPEVLDRKAGIEAIVVSSETLPGARGINIIREEQGMKPIAIVEVATVLAKDNLPISSTRIRLGDITPDGRRKTGAKTRAA
jgi:pantetheine-phosphate adenylyltransferase